MSRKQAREDYNDLMAKRTERLTYLRDLLATNGVELNYSDESIQQVNDWLRENVEVSPYDPRRMGDTWYAVVLDLGLFLGEALLARVDHLRWALHIWGKAHFDYQRHVIAGFTNTPIKNYTVNLDGIVSVHGHRIIQDLDVEPDEFLRVINSCLNKA